MQASLVVRFLSTLRKGGPNSGFQAPTDTAPRQKSSAPAGADTNVEAVRSHVNEDGTLRKGGESSGGSHHLGCPGFVDGSAPHDDSGGRDGGDHTPRSTWPALCSQPMPA